MRLSTVSSRNNYLPRAGVVISRHNQPELRLWASVIALAVSDAIISDKKIKKYKDFEKVAQTRWNRESARRFLQTEWFAQICEWLDIDPRMVIRSIAEQTDDEWAKDMLDRLKKRSKSPKFNDIANA